MQRQSRWRACAGAGLGLALALALGAAPALGLEPSRQVTQYVHEAWQAREGLPPASLYALLQARQGDLWLGTSQGLVHFDGVRFTVHELRGGQGWHGQQVLALAEGVTGALWVGTEKGLGVWHQGQLSLPEGLEELAGVRVGALLAEGQELWAGTSEGLVHWGADGLERYGPREGLTDSRVWAVYRDRQGTLWAGTGQGLARLVGRRFEPVPLPVGDTPVRALQQGLDGTLWVGTGQGLVRLREGRATHLPLPGQAQAEPVLALLEDRHGSLWLGTASRGLWRYTAGTFTPVGAVGGSAGSAQVLALLEDREGSVWTATPERLHRLRAGAFTPWGVLEGLPTDSVVVVREDRHGTLWVGTADSGLLRQEAGRFSRFGVEQGLSASFIRSLAEAPDGTLWVTTPAGVFHHDGQRFHALERRGCLAQEVLYATWPDRHGAVWFGTSNWLCRLKEGTLTAVGPGQGLPAAHVLSLAEDGAGTLWAATTAGLVRVEGDTLQRYTTAEGLAGDLVMDLSPDSQGGLWVGTSNGLSLWRNGRLYRLTMAEGLFDDMVMRVLEDAQGHLWLSCNRGIFRLERGEVEAVLAGRQPRLRSQVFTLQDGLRSADVMGGGVSPAGWRARDGRLWFPTLRGLAVVDPAEVGAGPLLPQARLLQVQVAGQPARAEGTLELMPEQSPLELQVGVDSLVAAARVRLRYRLEGHDQGWHEAQGRQGVSYRRLAAGRYRFWLSAAGPDGAWSEPRQVLEVVQAAPLYARAWFWALCLLLAAGTGTGLYALRMRRLQARERWLEERVAERTRELERANRELDEHLRALRETQAQLVQAGRMAAVGTLAAGVGHEINNPLAYIVTNLEYACQEARALGRELPVGPGRERLGELERALREALHGTDRVRRIAKDLKTLSREESAREPVDLHAVLEAAANMAAHELLPRARLEWELGEVPRVEGSEPRLVQVFLNLLVNAAQAMPEGQPERNEVRLVTRREGDLVVVEVRDTGSGIPPEVMTRIFDPFFTTKPVGVGTGLGLALSQAFLKAMGGDIQVESEVGRGTTLRVLLRVAPEAVAQAAEAQQAQAAREVEQAAVQARAAERQRGRVLVVDDDPMVSSALRRTLGREHEVEVQGSSRAALARLVSPEGLLVDVVLCDLMMPELTGMDLHAALQSTAPPLAGRLVFMTGGAFTPAAQAFLEQVDNPRLEKPFEPERLREQVRGWVQQARAGRNLVG